LIQVADAMNRDVETREVSRAEGELFGQHPRAG
jgi:hypothetical protein